MYIEVHGLGYTYSVRNLSPAFSGGRTVTEKNLPSNRVTLIIQRFRAVAFRSATGTHKTQCEQRQRLIRARTVWHVSVPYVIDIVSSGQSFLT